MKYRKISLFLVAIMVLGMLSAAFVMVPSVSAYTITVDGDPSDWAADASAQAVNTGKYYATASGGEYVWKDIEGDDTGNGTYTYPTTYNGMEADLLEFRVTSDANWLYMLVRLADIVPGQWNRTHLAIVCDTTPTVAGDGLHEWVWQEADVKLSDGTGVKWNWQYLLGHWKGIGFFMGDTQPWVEFIGLPASIVANDSTTNCFEIAINKSHCGDFNSKTWRFGVFVGLHNRHDSVWEFTGNAHEYRFSEVLETASATNPGGSSGDSTTHDRDPNIFDCAFFSTQAAQEAALDDWDRVGDNPPVLDPNHMGAFKEILFADPDVTYNYGQPTQAELWARNGTGFWNLTCTYTTNETWDMNVSVSNVYFLGAWQLGFEWNPAVVDLLGWTIQYGWFGPSGSVISFGGAINHATGKMAALAVSFSAAPWYVNGSGVVLTLNFKALTDFQLAGHWMNFTTVKMKDNVGNTIPIYQHNVWFWCPPPAPYGPDAIISENATWIYLGQTIHLWSTSARGFNGTHMIDIATCTWTIKDSLGVVVLGPTTIDCQINPGCPIDFTPAYADTYTVNLTVVTKPDVILDPNMNKDTALAAKLVIIPFATGIDCFTERERWSGYLTDYTGEGPNMTADTYALDEEVTLFAKVIYNDWPRQSVLVSFEVYDGKGRLVLLRTAMTNGSGIANITFRIMTVCGDPEYAFGKWRCYQKVYMCEQWYEDTLWFQVAWVMELQEVIPYKGGVAFPYWPPADQYYNPGDIMEFKVFFKNWAFMPRHELLTIVVYDADGVPIVQDKIECFNIPGGSFCAPYEVYPFEFRLEIPKWVYCGWATVYVNLFNDWPSNCGHPWCPEISYTFLIKAP